MSAYAVKHIVEEQGPLLANIKAIKQTPHSYTSKEPEASDAASGNEIFVIEVRREGRHRTYWLGYKYQAHRRFTPAGGGKWKDQFLYKNSAEPMGKTVGYYFDALPKIASVAICDWLLSQTLGMARMPDDLAAQLDAFARLPVNGAKRFV